MRVASSVLLILTILGVATGCDSQAPISDSPRPPIADREAPVPEASFAEQARAVRDGTTDSIRIDHGIVSDIDLAQLAGLEQKLASLNLSHTEITDTGLASIARCQNLQQLRLESPQLTDQGLAVLPQLPRLKHLHLIGAPLTDEAVPHLESLPGLSSLYLDDTKLTLGGMRQLTEKLGSTHIHFDGGHHRDDAHADDHRR